MNSFARLLLLACLLLPAVADARIWKLREGREIDGELQKADEFNVTIKTSQGWTSEPRYKFSDEDKAYLNKVAPVFKATELNLDPPGTLPIHSKMYDAQERLLRKDLANYYGLTPTNKKDLVVSAEWIQKLSSRERIVMLDQSIGSESGRIGRLNMVISQRQIYEGYVADEEAKGRSLKSFTGLTLEDGTRVTAEFVAGMPPPVRWALLKIAHEDEAVRTKGIRKEALELKKSQAEEKELLEAAVKYNASQAEAIAAKKRETFEKYVDRVKEYARLEREMLNREADKAQAVAAVEEQKVAREQTRLANEERKRLDRDAKRAAALAAEVERERQQLKRDERLAAERNRQRSDERLAFFYNSIPSLGDLFRSRKLVKGLVLVVVLLSGVLYWTFGARRQGAG